MCGARDYIDSIPYYTARIQRSASHTLVGTQQTSTCRIVWTLDICEESSLKCEYRTDRHIGQIGFIPVKHLIAMERGIFLDPPKLHFLTEWMERKPQTAELSCLLFLMMMIKANKHFMLTLCQESYTINGLSHLNLTAILASRHFLHFTNEELRAQRRLKTLWLVPSTCLIDWSY